MADIILELKELYHRTEIILMQLAVARPEHVQALQAEVEDMGRAIEEFIARHSEEIGEAMVLRAERWLDGS